jgi:hypothetical protein
MAGVAISGCTAGTFGLEAGVTAVLALTIVILAVLLAGR